jgi:metal-dependent amidase/aminoacylase/carboxypeptidase family protein
VQLTGTARTFSENNRSLFAKGVERLAQSTAAFFGAEANVQYRHLVPSLVNSPKAIPTVRAAVTDVLSQAGVVSGYRATCVDDFSLYLQEVEGVYILVGCKEQEYYPVHNNNFYVPEESMIIALMILYRLIKSELFV